MADNIIVNARKLKRFIPQAKMGTVPPSPITLLKGTVPIFDKLIILLLLGFIFLTAPQGLALAEDSFLVTAPGEGNLGVGTSTPLAKLDIKAAGTDTGVALKIQNSDGVNKLIILDKGWVGIGTTPAYALHVDGDIRASGAIWGSTGIQVPVGTGTVNKMVKWFGTGTTLSDTVAYDDGTNIGIGLTNPTYKLDVSGTMRVSGTGTIGVLTLTNPLAIAQGGTAATDITTARSNLGLSIGSNVQAYDAGLQSIA
ncbi:MAG: hypothetical protein WC628_09380, partial [Candidatus Omnitrophota bacterium]